MKRKEDLKKKNQKTNRKPTNKPPSNAFSSTHVKTAEYLLWADAKYLHCIVIKALAAKAGR